MTHFLRSVVALAPLLAAALPSAAQQPRTSVTDSDEVAAKVPYHPGLGELMTAFVQPRHIKLGLAGAAQNWAYAAYELGELRETFDDVGKLVLKHGNLEVARAIAATVTQPMDAVDAAIKAKDRAAFTKAY